MRRPRIYPGLQTPEANREIHEIRQITGRRIKLPVRATTILAEEETTKYANYTNRQNECEDREIYLEFGIKKPTAKYAKYTKPEADESKLPLRAATTLTEEETAKYLEIREKLNPVFD